MMKKMQQVYGNKDFNFSSKMYKLGVHNLLQIISSTPKDSHSFSE